MKEQKRILELTDFEWRLLVECLNTARSKYIDECKLIEDVNMLLIKTMKRLSQILCKPPMWCRIETTHWRNFLCQKEIAVQKNKQEEKRSESC